MLTHLKNLREAFIELFCAPRNSIADPAYRTNNYTSPSNYIVLEYGGCGGYPGYCVEDEETGEEGIVEEMKK